VVSEIVVVAFVVSEIVVVAVVVAFPVVAAVDVAAVVVAAGVVVVVVEVALLVVVTLVALAPVVVAADVVVEVMVVLAAVAAVAVVLEVWETTLPLPGGKYMSRLLPLSATNRAPELSSATAVGPCRAVAEAPLVVLVRSICPHTLVAAFLPGGKYRRRLLPVSAT